MDNVKLRRATAWLANAAWTLDPIWWIGAGAIAVTLGAVAGNVMTGGAVVGFYIEVWRSIVGAL
jgi:hypothetical protein